MYSLTNFHGCGHRYPQEISSRVFVTPNALQVGHCGIPRTLECDTGPPGRLRDYLGRENHLVWWCGQGPSFWYPWRGFASYLESHWRTHRSWMHHWLVGVMNYPTTYKWQKDAIGRVSANTQIVEHKRHPQGGVQVRLDETGHWPSHVGHQV